MGKYDEILPSLPALPVADQRFQDKVNAEKDSMREEGVASNADSLAGRYAELRAQKDELEEGISLLNIQIEATLQLLLDSKQSGAPEWGAYGSSPNTLRRFNGDKIQMLIEPYATVVDKEANRKWAEQNGLANLLSLPWQTVNSLTKERLLNGEPEPDGVQVFAKPKLVFTRAK